MNALIYILAIVLVFVAFARFLLPKQFAHVFGRRELAALVYLPTVAFLSPLYVAYCLLVILFIALVRASKEEQLRLFVFCVPLLPALQWGLPAPAPITRLFDFNYNTLLVVGCMGLILYLYSRSRGSFSLYNVLMIAMIATLTFAAARGTSVTSYLRAIVEYSFLTIIPFYLLSRGTVLMRSPRDLLLAFVLSGVFLSLVALFESLRYWPLYEFLNQKYNLESSFYVKLRAGQMRANATFPESTSLSLYFGLCAVLVFALRRFFKPGQLAAFLIVLTAGMLSTLGRVGPFIAIIGIIAVLWYERRYVVLVAISVASPLAYGLASVAATFVPTIAALLGRTEDTAGTLDYRTRLWERLIEEIARNPLIGNPEEAYSRLEDMRQGEGIIDLVNTPLSMALEAGIVGAVMFFSSSVVVLVALVKLRKSKDAELVEPAAAVFAALVALLAGLVTTSLWDRTLLLLVILLAIGSGLAVRGQLARRRRSTERQTGRELGLAA